MLDTTRASTHEPICRVLPIAPSTYREHAARARDPARAPARQRRDVALAAEVRRIWSENFQVYGVRKIWRQLARDGFDVARCTVARLMRQMGIKGAVRGKALRTTVRDPSAPCPQDRVNRQFHAPAPNVLWLSDFTYGAPRPGWSGVHMTGMQRRKEELNERLALCCEGA